MKEEEKNVPRYDGLGKAAPPYGVSTHVRSTFSGGCTKSKQALCVHTNGVRKSETLS